jgi:hypothetical protein
MSLQYRSNEEAFDIICRVYHKIKRRFPRDVKGINITRIGILNFNLTSRKANSILSNSKYREERLRLREVGGGFLRGDRPPKKRDPIEGRII